MAASFFCVAKRLSTLHRFAKKIKKFFQKERHTLGLILHINYRAYKQNVRGIQKCSNKNMEC